jgi:hypothetical protein
MLQRLAPYLHKLAPATRFLQAHGAGCVSEGELLVVWTALLDAVLGVLLPLRMVYHRELLLRRQWQGLAGIPAASPHARIIDTWPLYQGSCTVVPLAAVAAAFDPLTLL